MSDERYYMAKDRFNKLFCKYKNVKSVYLLLCGQLNNVLVDVVDSGGI